MIFKSKKLFVLLSSMVFIAVVGTACGAARPETVAETVDVEQEGEEVQEVTVDPTACNLGAPESSVEINYIGWPFEATQFYADELRKCGDVENIEVNIQFLDFTQTVEAVNLALSSGGDSPYDVVHATNPEIALWGPEDWLLPLDDLIEEYRDEYNLDDIPQSAWEGSVVNGQILGVPVVADSQAIAYRSDLFEEVGLDVPENYDEIIAACDVLEDVEGIEVPFVIDFSAGWAMEIEFLAALRSYGGDYLNEDNTPAFNGPEGVDALTKMLEVRDACMGDAYLAYGYEAGEAGINNGSVAFTSIWATSMASMSDPEESEFSDVIEYAPAAAPKPGGPLGGTAWLNYYTIPATTTNDPDLIFRAIMEVADTESQREAAKFGVVTRTTIEEGVPTLSAVNETIAKGVGPYENNPAIPLVQVALGEQLPLAFDGSMTPQEALDAAAEAYVAEATAQGFLP